MEMKLFQDQDDSTISPSSIFSRSNLMGEIYIVIICIVFSILESTSIVHSPDLCNMIKEHNSISNNNTSLQSTINPLSNNKNQPTSTPSINHHDSTPSSLQFIHLDNECEMTCHVNEV